MEIEKNEEDTEMKDDKNNPVIQEEKKDNRTHRAQPGPTLNNSTKANKPECFQCKICPYNTLRRPFLDKHMQQKHGFSKVKVAKKNEGSSYSQKADLEVIKNNGKIMKETEESENDESEDIEFGCELCDFKTKYQNVLNLHLEVHEVEDGEMYQCNQCNFKTEEVNALRDHERTHKKLEIFNCPTCDYATRQKCNLRAHLKIHEDPVKLNVFNCDICKKFVSFHYSALLRHNKLTHGIEGKGYRCDKCPYVAKIPRLLTSHQKIHGGPNLPQFKCEKCDFATYNEQTIQRHCQRHEEREKVGEEVIVKEQGEEKEIIWFCCNLCDFRSREQRYVILHKKVHTRIDEINKIGETLMQSTEKKTDVKPESS